MQEITLLITTLTPTLAFVGTFVTIFMTIKNAQSTRKAALITAYINAKIEHIKNFKVYLQMFLDEYITNSIQDPQKLMVIKAKIDTSMLGDEEAYKPFHDYLENCMVSEFSMEIYTNMMHIGEEVVDAIWDKIKLETGLNLNAETSLLKSIGNSTVGMITPRALKKLMKKNNKQHKTDEQNSSLDN
ncbi:MAG: hypothetical protein FWF56_01395 [Firmicutes bacterium]|nr:hypothetical protein [Bacillota bacterium]MCL1953944.1 hypothetical protein [Bacillota bacterium]